MKVVPETGVVGDVKSTPVKKDSRIKGIMKVLLHNKLAVVGGSIFLILVLIAIFADVIAPYDYLKMDLTKKYLPVSWEHLFGTDAYGRDIFSRVIYGSRWSLTLGVAGTLLSTVFGVILGAIAGYFGGVVDMIIMRLIDVVQCMPNILLVICISAVLGGGFVNTIIALSIGGIWGNARILRAQILTVRKQEYVEAAKATNNKNFRVIMKYVLPNSIQPIIVSACTGIGGTIMMASGLSFIGLGVQPPTPEWGAMLNDAQQYMRYYPGMMLAPLIFLSLTVFSISIFGDGLRDALDPRLRH